MYRLSVCLFVCLFVFGNACFRSSGKQATFIVSKIQYTVGRILFAVLYALIDPANYLGPRLYFARDCVLTARMCVWCEP